MLKQTIRRLTEELAKANDTIDFQSRLLKQNQQNLQHNYEQSIKPFDLNMLDSTGAANDSSKVQGPGETKIEHRQIITQRIVKDQEKVDQFFNEKAE